MPRYQIIETVPYGTGDYGTNTKAHPIVVASRQSMRRWADAIAHEKRTTVYVSTVTSWGGRFVHTAKG